MIERTASFKTSDGDIFGTVQEAQIHELKLLLDSAPIDTIPARLVKESEKVIDILTTTSTSKARARSINGGKKSRKPKPALVEPAKP